MTQDSPAPLVVWAGLGLLALWVFLRWFEAVNLFIPARGHQAHPGTYGLAYEDLFLEAEDGGRPHAWFLDAGAPSKAGLPLPPPLRAAPLELPTGPRPVAVMFHGNAGNISDRLDKARALRAMGLSVLLFDYRGYGKSAGRPSERGLYRDGDAAVSDALRRAGGDARRLVFVGESLGCAVALEEALRRPPAALVLESPFASTAAMSRLVYPWLPADLLVRQRFDNVGKAPRLRTPLLVLHSPQDDVVPYAMGRQVYFAAPEPKAFVETRGGHNDGFMETAYWASSIRDFLQPLLRQRI
ncbi:MAG: alpha/beta hydrolase [Elusimicrobia bacterium]|nr:alpha/beta hydrolase [Elusimicrobiota bacterium]